MEVSALKECDTLESVWRAALPLDYGETYIQKGWLINYRMVHCNYFFNILGLIAAAGLTDRLLRKQLREVLENKSWASKK